MGKVEHQQNNIARDISIEIGIQSKLSVVSQDEETIQDENSETVNSGTPLVDAQKEIRKEDEQETLSQSTVKIDGIDALILAPGVLKNLVLRYQICLKYAYAGISTIACLTLVCLFLTNATASPTETRPQNLDRITLLLDQENSRRLPAEIRYASPQFSWEKILNHMGHLHFDAGGINTRGLNQNVGELKGQFSQQSLTILGRPSFCTETHELTTPNLMVFQNVTDLDLSNMDNCHHYVNLILGEWRYPKVRQLRLHKVVIREEEFISLGKFIQIHNETLVRVEIDESYLCPSPVCDAGMLTFPEHDFQLIIRKRKESPEYVL